MGIETSQAWTPAGAWCAHTPRPLDWLYGTYAREHRDIIVRNARLTLWESVSQ